VRRFAYAPSWEFGLSGMLSASVRVLPSSVSSNLLAKPPLPPPPAAAPQAPARQPIDFGPADILVMLDSSWLLNVWPHVRRAKEVGTKVVVAVYDLIPFTHPETVHDDVRVFFKSWYDLSLYYADAYICISETVGKAVTGWIETEWKARGWSRTIKVGHFHLGSDMAYTPVPQPIRPALIAHFEDEAPVFAMVGTLEPRKNHSFVLDAFDILWNSGDESRLLIAGRPGWKVDFLYRRIVAHPEYAKRLLVYHDLNDTELEYVYKKSRALVFASVAEGFGLPIVEAFKEGLTVICSNIEVFQEIASGRATFFDLDSPRHLAAAVRDTVATPRGPQKKAKWLSWLESTQQFVTQVMELASTSHETARLEKSSRPQTQRKATRSVGPQA
jgi:alpha-1,2-rhamnosyltransferase